MRLKWILAGAALLAFFVAATLLARGEGDGDDAGGADDPGASLPAASGSIPPFFLEAAIEVEGPHDGGLLPEVAESGRSILRWWYGPPGKWRWEIETVEPALSSGVFGMVSDGEDFWYYESSQNTYRKLPAELPPGVELLPPGISVLIGPAFAEDVPALLEQLRSRGGGARAELAGNETLLGRETQVIELGPTARLWVDAERMFVLRWEDRGSGQFVRAEVTALEYDVRAPDDRFAFTPPPGAQELPEQADAVRCSGEGSFGGSSISVPEGFLRPSYVPEGYVVAGTSSESGSDCALIATEVVLRAGPGSDGGPYVRLQQRMRRDGIPAALRAGDAVSVDGGEAYRLAVDGIERLVWVDGDVVAVLSSDALPFSELLRMAESASVQ